MSDERLLPLIIKCKIRLRKLSTNELDNDIAQLIVAAAEDLKRFGIKDIDIDSGSGLIDEAILMFVQANYGANPNQENLMQSYNAHCGRLAFSEHNGD